MDTRLSLGDFMLAVRHETQIMKVAAVMVRDISYCNFEGTVTVKAGTEIEVDVNTHIALIGDQHVELQPQSYRLGYRD
jgi:hypothetical protein